MAWMDVLTVLTGDNQIENFDAYMRGEVKITVSEPKPKPAEAVEAKPEPKPEVKAEAKTENAAPAKQQPRANAPQNNQPKQNQAPVQNFKKNEDNRNSSRDTRFDKRPDFSQQKQKQKPQKPAQNQNTRPVTNTVTSNPAPQRREELTIQSSDSRNQHRAAVNTRIVDTRSTSVDLSKYDEKLDTFVSDTKNNSYSPEKQKFKKPNAKGGNDRDKERRNMEKIKKMELEKARKQQLSITVPDEITVGELAARLKVTASVVIKKLFELGVMANVNQVVDYDTAYLVGEELGAKVTKEVVVTIEERKTPTICSKPAHPSLLLWVTLTTVRPPFSTLSATPTLPQVKPAVSPSTSVLTRCALTVRILHSLTPPDTKRSPQCVQEVLRLPILRSS